MSDCNNKVQEHDQSELCVKMGETVSIAKLDKFNTEIIFVTTGGTDSL